MVSPVLRTDAAPNHLLSTFDALSEWASRPSAEDDLEKTFGSSLDWAAAYRLLHAFRHRDFSSLPAVACLEPGDMPGLLGGYSRDLNRIFLAADCPDTDRTAVLLEEIGHFLDHALCSEETPGDEGAVFAALVLGGSPAPWVGEDRLWPLRHEGGTVLVEAARKLRGSLKNAGKFRGKSRGLGRKGKGRNGNKNKSAAPDNIISKSGDVVYTFEESVRVVQTKAGQRLIGSRGDDTYVVLGEDVRIEDPRGGTDTIESRVSFSLVGRNPIENLALAGSAHINGTGNFRANLITGNSGNNRLDGGNDSQVDTLVGGAGNDTYVLDDTLDLVIELPGGGSDTIETTINAPSLADFQADHVENLTFTGEGSATLVGNALANVLTGGNEADTLYGAAGDTLVGRQGDDLYYAQHATAVIVEGDGPLDGNDTVSTALSTYSIANFANVEVLEYTGARNSSLTGNSGNNEIYGSLLPRNTINGGEGDDYLYGGDTTDSLFGGGGDDTLAVTRWSDTPVGALGVALRTNRGSDILNGGAGDDWYVVDSQTAYTYQDSAGTNTVASTVDFSLKYNRNISDNLQNLYLIGADSLRGTGSDLANMITGNDGDNIIAAGGGGDSVQGGLGADFINGETGNDTLIGGGQPQTDLPADASTAITIRSGESYTGKIDFRRDTDWIRAELFQGITYTFELAFTPLGSDGLKQYSDAAFGEVGRDITPSTISEGWWAYFSQIRNANFLPFIGDSTADLDSLLYSVGSRVDEANHRNDHTLLVLDSAGSRADGAVDYNPNDPLDTNANENVIRFKFTPFTTGEFYIPISGAGPLGGAYTVKLTDPETSSVEPNPILADDGSNTLVGGFGNDLLIAGNGRDSLGDPIGDVLLGGTNGVPGGVDLDRGISAKDILVGEFYQITSIGTTNWVNFGAANSTLGTVFKATNAGSVIGGTGQVRQIIGAADITPGGFYQITSLGTTDWTNLGASRPVVGEVFQATLTGSGDGQVALPLDTLRGGLGADLLDGGNEMDLMIGGAGDDTYYIDERADIVVEEDNGGQDDIGVFSYAAGRVFADDLTGGLFENLIDPALNSLTGAGFDVDLANGFRNVEHASLMGSANLYVLGNGDPNSLFGNFGDNLLVGANGNDSLLGQGGNDYLVGGDGGDLLDGGAGQNTMDGGFGDDTYVVNDRDDRVIKEIAGLDGGVDLVRTYFNFDPIQGSPLTEYQPDQPDNSPSVTKSPSFASRDLQSFYNLENFELLGEAAYGVGNSLGNQMRTSAGVSALLLGMGGDDSLFGTDDPELELFGNDSLFGDTPDFYASPDLYAPAPTDTFTQDFIDGIGLSLYGNDYLDGGAGDDYIDGGRGFDVMVGGTGNDTFVQDNVDDLVIATVEGGENGANELISSVNIAQAPDGISKIMLVVANQDPSSGQAEVANFASFLGSEGGNQLSNSRTIGGSTFTIENANVLELIYAPRKGTTYTEGGTNNLLVGTPSADLGNPGKESYELSWTATGDAASTVAGYTVLYMGADNIWRTYVNGKSQDFQGTRQNPTLVVNNLEPGSYQFQVVAHEIAIPALQSRLPDSARHVTLQGGGGNDAVIGTRYISVLPGGLGSDAFTNPLLWNNPIDPLPLGFIFNPGPFNSSGSNPFEFATYLDGGFGDDFLDGAFVNDGSGSDYVQQGVVFKGLNTLVGGQGSDTFVVNNGGTALGAEFDWVVKYENETPIVTEEGNLGSFLNGGQHNLVVSLVDFLTLSDQDVHQGKFIDQLNLPGSLQFGMGNRLDNYIYETSLSVTSRSTLVGNTGRDSIVGTSKGNLLVGGTAYGMDNVGLAIRDFASVADGGNGLQNSIFRDTDPVPVELNGPGAADPGQFWFVPGYYGAVFDPARNRDTLVSGGTGTTLDGGAGADYLFGSGPGDDDDQSARRGDIFIVSQGLGGNSSQNINAGDAVFGNGGNDTVIFTDSDYLWWSGHEDGTLLDMNGYTIASDISNLILQMGAPTARNASGNSRSVGNDHGGWFDEVGSNRIVGNEFDNILDGGGVGGQANVGGFDTLTGGGGSDLFYVRGYTGASNNQWNPVYNSDTGNWNSNASTYTDSDYVLITDFTVQDILDIGITSDFWIGGTPGDYNVGNLNEFVREGLAPSASEFGIFRSNRTSPDMVAHVRLADGLRLDVANIGTWTKVDPAGDGSRGIFYEISGVQFLQGGSTIAGTDLFNPANYNQQASTASLSSLIGQIA